MSHRMSHLAGALRPILIAAALLLPLSACRTAAPAKPALSPQQIAVLQEQGFKQTDDGWELSFTDKLLFDLDAAVLTQASRAGVAKISGALRQVGIEHMQVEGHTDISGSAAHNDKLSLARAKAVAEAMTLSGLAHDNILVRGMGKHKPVADNATAEGRAENRRVTVIVSAP
jgi:outer membrane protein OmpA-like peptidoglycan-associated protein